MSESTTYSPGTKVVFSNGVNGEVVSFNDERFKKKFVVAGDVCVIWETGEQATYSKWWLDEFTTKESEAGRE